MDWNLEEALTYYKSQGAPNDQTALTGLLREVQQNCGGSIPLYVLRQAAQSYGIKESFLQAIIKRIPSLRLGDTHELVLCAGPNCGKHTALAAYAESIAKASNGKIVMKYSQCMRMCGKGPNIKWDGVLYHQANEALLKKLAEQTTSP